MNNAGLIMGCVVEGLALSDVDQSLVVDNQITIKFKNKGSEIIIENFSDNGIITVNLTRLEAIEMVRVISKYYGFSVKLTANERGQ